MRGPGEPARHRGPVTFSAQRQRRRRQRLAVIVAALGTTTVLLVAYGFGGPTVPQRAGSRGPTRQRSTSRARDAATTTTSVPPTSTSTTTSPGSLPQTDALPPSTSPQFHVEMADLWQSVVTGNANLAMPAFFPLGAYAQLKAIPDPQADWHDRLVAAFTLDVVAAHDLLGTTAATAQLVSVNVPSQYAHWVTSGVCYNSIGYYEVPDARVVYRVDGAVRSFGIASMISWRGQWYVVHFGAVLRTTTGQGVVDDPATGPGTSAYSATC
jgi:hypothetical protein